MSNSSAKGQVNISYIFVIMQIKWLQVLQTKYNLNTMVGIDMYILEAFH